MMCYGQAISRTTYAELFSAIGTTYGAGDGSSTFNLPDLRGRVVAGLDNMGGTSADRLTGLSGGVNGDVLGASGGVTTTSVVLNSFPASGNGVGDSNFTTSGLVAGGMNNKGGSGAHNNIQPTLIVSYIIKAFNGSSYSGVDPVSILQSVYPVGSIYTNATNNTNPATLLGFGTWAAWGAGRMPVGYDSSQAEFNAQEKTGGAKTHTLSVSEMPYHNHTINQRISGSEAGGYGLTGASGFMNRVIVDSSNPDFTTKSELISSKMAEPCRLSPNACGCTSPLAPPEKPLCLIF